MRVTVDKGQVWIEKGSILFLLLHVWLWRCPLTGTSVSLWRMVVICLWMCLFIWFRDCVYIYASVTTCEMSELIIPVDSIAEWGRHSSSCLIPCLSLSEISFSIFCWKGWKIKSTCRRHVSHIFLLVERCMVGKSQGCFCCCLVPFWKPV